MWLQCRLGFDLRQWRNGSSSKLTYIDVFLCSFCKSLLTDNFPVSVPFEIQSNIISNCLSMLRYEFRLSIELLRSVYI
jgi:hypothetical protein